MGAGPTIDGQVPYDVQRKINQTYDDVQTLKRLVAQLQQQIAAMPAPLTLPEISQGLSATGAAPLNLTGLTGKPATTP